MRTLVASSGTTDRHQSCASRGRASHSGERIRPSVVTRACGVAKVSVLQRVLGRGRYFDVQVNYC
jgi:hypothetical protein